MSDWKPNGIVTLLTDFGLDDPYVGVMKGVLHARFPAVRTIDLSHRVEPQSVVQAAWFLAHGRRYFPPGTVHLAVVDPGVGTHRRILVDVGPRRQARPSRTYIRQIPTLIASILPV